MSSTLCVLPIQVTSSRLIRSCTLMCFCLISGTQKTRCRFRLITCQKSVAEPYRSPTMCATTTMALCLMAHSLTLGEQNNVPDTYPVWLYCVHVRVLNVLFNIFIIVIRAWGPMTHMSELAGWSLEWIKDFLECVWERNASSLCHHSLAMENMETVNENYCSARNSRYKQS